MVERLLDVVERLGREPLAREHVGDPGRIGGERLGGHAARPPRAPAPPPGGRGTRPAGSSPARPRAAAAARTASSVRSSGRLAQRIDSVPERRHQARPGGRDVLAHAEDRDHHVLARELEVHVVALAHDAARARSRCDRCRARRSPGGAGRSRTRPGRRPGARRARRAPAARAPPAAWRPGRAASRPSSSWPRTAALRRAASSEPAEERAGARGLDQGHAAVHDLLLDQVAVARGGSSRPG